MRTDEHTLEIRSGRRPLVDEPVGLVATGARPGSPIAVRATVEVAGAVHQATATFEADQAGVVDTARQASQTGSYTGVDPFGLWWSGDPVGPSDRPPFAPLTAHIQATTADGTAEAVLERHWLAAGATLTPVREPGVWGLFARPAGAGPFPAVVGFGGSSGGLAAAAAWAPVLASHGFATLAIAYFGVPGLPEALAGIEVEVVERAAAWLLGRADIASGRVAVVGMSRGSELALLAGALLDRVGAVVAFAPSGVAWCGFGPAGPVDTPAWTFRGAPVPYLGGDATPPPGFRTSGPIALRPLFERLLQDADADAVRAAEIPVERASDPILLVSGEADAMWPSTRLGELVERRAAAHRSAHQVTHLRYPDAGHAGVGVPGTPAPTEIRHPVDGRRYALGGTPAGNAAARADSWPQVLAFLASAS
jgi:dienelactone hydrolase